MLRAHSTRRGGTRRVSTRTGRNRSGGATGAQSGNAGLVVFLVVTLVLLMVLVALVARRAELQRSATPVTTSETLPARVAEVELPVPPPPGNIRGGGAERPDAPVIAPDVPKFRPEPDVAETPAGPSAPIVTIAPSVTQEPEHAAATDAERVLRAESALRHIVTGVARFRYVVGRNPRTLAELERPISGHADGVLGVRGTPADGWGRPFAYGGSVGSTGPVWVRSDGADGAVGGRGAAGDLVATFDD